MAERYLFFNAIEDEEGFYDREYEASDFADYFRWVLSSGLFHTDEVPGMNVSIESGTMNTIVGVGGALLRGRLYENTNDLTLKHGISDSAHDRIDRIVLRLDLRPEARYIRAFIIEGEPSSDPVAPELQRDSHVHEISLAQVRVEADTSSLKVDDLTDERLDEELCGLVSSMITPPTGMIQQQWNNWFSEHKGKFTADFNAWVNAVKEDFQEWNTEQQEAFSDWRDGRKDAFDSWFDNVRGQLDEDTAGNLQNQIDELSDKSLLYALMFG